MKDCNALGIQKYAICTGRFVVIFVSILFFIFILKVWVGGIFLSKYGWIGCVRPKIFAWNYNTQKKHADIIDIGHLLNVSWLFIYQKPGATMQGIYLPGWNYHCSLVNTSPEGDVNYQSSKSQAL